MPELALEDVVTANRAEIARLKEELTRVRRAPLPLDQVRAHAKAQLDRLEKSYLDVVSNAARRLACMQKPMDANLASSIGCRAEDKAAFALGMTVHFHRDALLDELMALVECAPTAPRLPAPARLEQADTLARKLYVLEQQDEKLVEELGIERRPDADPRAVLGLPETVAFEPRGVDLMGVLCPTR